MSVLSAGIPAQAAGFSLSQASAVINAGEQADLDIQGSAKLARFTSADDNIATVDQDGVVTGIRAGQTTVTARIGATGKTCKVSVITPSIKLNKEAVTVYTGASVKAKATVKGTDKTVTWESSNGDVATVDEKGSVTAVAPGKAIIKAKANGKQAAMKVTVVKAGTSLNNHTASLSTRKPGNTATLKATVNGPKAAVTWTSSNPAVASVKAGKVTAKAEGTAVITATANGISDTCSVTVKKGSVNITQDAADLYLGGTEVKTLKLTTNAGKNETLEWRSHDSNIVAVDAKGVLTAKAKGQTTVEAVSSDGTNDICVVTVSGTATEILENEVVLKTKGYDRTHTLTTAVNGKTQKITWKSGNTKVVTVKNGKLTAKKAGEATVTATANGVSDTVKVTVNDFEPSVTLSQSQATLYTGKGNTLTLKAAVDGSSTKAAWSSSDASVADVSSKGKVTAKKEGSATITATANGVSDTCTVTVKETKTVLPESLYMAKGDTAELDVDVIGKSQKVTWKTGNKKVVAVKNGVLTAKGYGEADITATANGKSAVCHVTVSECTHTFDSGVVTKEPSCGAEGVKTFTCKLCKATYTESIPMTDDHEWGGWHVTTEPTEDKEGVKERTCSVCKKVEKESLPKADHVHDYKAVNTVNATCTEQGYTDYACACGDTYQGDYKDALGHAWGNWQVTRRPTETVAGQMKHTCTRCRTIETKEIPAEGHTHSYTSKVTPATCTQKGYTTHTCACGDTYTDSYVNAKGHIWGAWKTTKEATEEEEGISTRYCANCGEAEARAIPKVEPEKPHEHEWKVVFTREPGCETQGCTKYACACGETYFGDYIPEVGHDIEEEVIKEPTCAAEGEKKLTCKREGCTYSVTRVIPKLEHEMEETVIREAHCEVTGESLFTCRLCGVKNHKEYPAPGHDWQFVKTISQASKAGSAGDYYACANCEEKKVDNEVAWHPNPEEIEKDMYTRVMYEYPTGTEWKTKEDAWEEGDDAYADDQKPTDPKYQYGYACGGLARTLQHELFGNRTPVKASYTDPSQLLPGDEIITYDYQNSNTGGHAWIVMETHPETQEIYTCNMAETNGRTYIRWMEIMTFNDFRAYTQDIYTCYY